MAHVTEAHNKWMAVVCACACAGFLAYGAPLFQRAIQLEAGSTETMATVVDHVTRDNHRLFYTQIAYFLVIEHTDAAGQRHVTRHRVAETGYHATADGERVWLRYATADSETAEIVPGYTRKKAMRTGMLAFVMFAASMMGLIGWMRQPPMRRVRV